MATETGTETKTETHMTPHPMADPAPLGLFGFASTTLVLSANNAGFTGVGVTTALALALFFGGLAQVLAGAWEFRNGNTFGAVAFTGYGMFWLSFWAIFHLESQLPAKDGGSYGVAWYLICWTIFTLVLLAATLRLNNGLVAVFGLLFITFLLLAIGEFSGTTAGNGITLVGGYFGIATAIAAFYMAAAGVMRAVGGMALPVGPRVK